MRIKKLNKSKLFSLLGAGLLATSSTLILASCSSNKQELINNSVLTNGLGKFTDSIDLKTMSSSLLKNNSTAQTNFADAAAGFFAYKWVENISKQDTRVKNALNAKKDLVNKTYNDTLKDYKEKYGSDYDIYFQQEFLDKNGGTEESYKQIELNKWAKQYLIDNVFATDVYVKLMKGSNPVTGGSLTTSELKKVFTNGTNGTANAVNGETYKFAFQADNDSEYAQKEYASFQQYIYDQWVQYTNPFLINNILWKYGQPPSGSSLSDYYLISTTSGSDGGSGEGGSEGGNTGGGDSSGGETTKQSSSARLNSNIVTYEEGSEGGEGGEGGTTTPSTSTGSYIYPYFSSSIPTGNNTTSTVKKYQDFVTLAASTNSAGAGQKNGDNTASSTTNAKVEDTNGLKKNLSQYSDDHTTSLMLVKNATSYSDLSSIQLAAASSFMLYKDVTFNGQQSEDGKQTTNPITKKNNISKKIATSWATTNIDPITDEFIWSNNNTSDGGSGAVSSTTSSTNSDNTAFTEKNAKVTLSSELVNEIISSKNLSSYRSKTLTSVDGFLASNVNGFIFIRDNDGVRAVSIEGGAYINKATSIDDLKTRAGNVVLFHYMNNLNGNDDTSIGSISIDLKSELLGYLTNNFNYLIFEYAKKMYTTSNGTLNTNEKSIPKIDSVFSDTNEKTLIENLVKYNFETSISTRRQDYRQKMYDAKSSYSSNFGIDAKKNGLAAPWIYGLKSNSGIYDYELLDTVPTADPYVQTKGSKKTFEESVENFTKSLVAQTSSFSGYKYSQYVYSNNQQMNYVLMNADDTSLSTIVRASIYNKKWKDLFNGNSNGEFKYNGFKNGSASTLNTKTDANTLNGYVDNALNNYFFSNVFDNLTTGKWLKYNELSKSSSSTEKTTNNQFDVEKLRTYRKNLWLENVKNNNDIDSFNSMLTVYATIDYLAKDNFKEFINYLKTKVALGKDAYITWTNSINESIYMENNPTQSSATTANGTSNLLEQKNLLSAANIKQNIENGYFSGYVGNSLLNGSNSATPPAPSARASAPTTSNNDLKNNTKDSLFNVGSNYYKISNGMLGFDGIQTSDSNSFPTTIQEILFTKPTNYNPDKKGLFYSFKDREGLTKYINNIVSNTQANDLADLIKARTGVDTSDIKNDIYSLKQKKEALLKLVEQKNGVSNGTSIITDKMFKPRDGIQTKEKQSEPSPPASKVTNPSNATPTNNLIENTEQASAKVKYAANVIQLNYDDVSSYENLSKRIMDSKVVGNNTSQTPGATASTTTNDEQQKAADEVIINLLVYAAVNETSLQNYVVSQLSEQNKVDVYDIRLNNGLGFDWVKNWKD